MPFDSLGWKNGLATREEFMAAEPMERLKMLSKALRNSPDNFKWDFGTWIKPHDCGHAGCAIGLAQVLWSFSETPVPDDEDLAPYLPYNFPLSFFVSTNPYGALAMGSVTPEMVADKIDAWIERHSDA